MQTIPFIKLALNELHRSLLREVRDLTPEQRAYRPIPEASSINFCTWHLARTEDNVFHRIATPHGGPSLWQLEKWNERFGLAPQDMGTGFTHPQVEALRPDKETLLAYCDRVFGAVMEGLDSLTDEDLDRVPNPEQPRNSVGQMIQSLLIGHGYWHLGEVRFIKGLQGMPFSR